VQSFIVKDVPENTALMQEKIFLAESRPLVEIQVQFLRLHGFCGSLSLHFLKFQVSGFKFQVKEAYSLGI
jgi:hypothetical protein